MVLSDAGLPFLSALLSVILIDLVLAGDNAIVIAMAVRSLPASRRKAGILAGSGAAVILRIALTFFVARLLELHYLKLAGGLLILWIAVKLFSQSPSGERAEAGSAGIWQSVKIIIIADITMATDNMLAVGGASHGNLLLLILGLGFSIPFVIFTSNLLSSLMDRYPVILYIGAAVLGKTGGEMIMTDPFTTMAFSPGRLGVYLVEAVCAAGVVFIGRFRARMKEKRAERAVDR